MNAFTKNDAVTYFCSWDGKGTITWRHAIVYSCGKKQMVLTDAETGKEMGRHFRPVNGGVVGKFSYAGVTLPRMTDDEARVAGLERAQEVYDGLVALGFLPKK